MMVSVISYKLDADQLALILMALVVAVVAGLALVAIAAIQIRGSVERERLAAQRPAQPAQAQAPVVILPNRMLVKPDGDHGVQATVVPERQQARPPRQWGYVNHG